LAASVLRWEWMRLVGSMFSRLPQLGWRSGRHAPGPAGSRLQHPLLHNPAHARQRVLDLGTMGNLLGRELVPAQTAGQIRPELELAQPDLEQLPTVRAGQPDPCAPV